MEKSVFLRAFEPDDCVLINKWRNDLAIQNLTGGTFRFVSLEREREWIRDKIQNNTTDIYLSVCLNDGSGKMIGYTSINNINYLHRTASRGGTVIGDEEYRDGVTAIDAILLSYEYSFDELNLNRVENVVITTHYTALYLCLAMGMKIEGMCRQSLYKHGTYYNQYLISIMREEYYSMRDSGEFEIQSILKKLKSIKKDGISNYYI